MDLVGLTLTFRMGWCRRVTIHGIWFLGTCHTSGQQRQWDGL